jgi:hypothetical protein
VREFRLHGSVRGALRDGRPYREQHPSGDEPASIRRLSLQLSPSFVHSSQAAYA